MNYKIKNIILRRSHELDRFIQLETDTMVDLVDLWLDSGCSLGYCYKRLKDSIIFSFKFQVLIEYYKISEHLNDIDTFLSEYIDKKFKEQIMERLQPIKLEG